MRIRYNSNLQSILIGVVFIGITLFVVRNQVPTDIVSPYLAGWFFDHSQFNEIYGFPVHTMFENAPPKAWVDVVAGQGLDAKTLYPYLYPPIWAAILAPLTRIMDISQFSWLFYLVQIPLIYGSIFFAWRLCNHPGDFAFWAIGSIFLTGVSVIGLSALAENQPQIFVTFLMIFGLERWLSGYRRWAGFLLALAATIKIFPVFLILFLVVARDWRAVFHMVIWGFLIVFLSFFLAGADLHFQYLDQLRALSGLAFLGQHNLSISGLLFQLQIFMEGEITQSIRYGRSFNAAVWVSLTNFSIMVFGLGLIARNYARQRNTALIVAALLLIGLTSPFGWSYYYLPLLYFWPLAFKELPRNKAVGATYLVFIPLLSLFQSVVRDGGFYNLAQIFAILAVFAAFCLFFWFGTRKIITKPVLTSRVD